LTSCLSRSLQPRRSLSPSQEQGCESSPLLVTTLSHSPTMISAIPDEGPRSLDLPDDESTPGRCGPFPFRVFCPRRGGRRSPPPHWERSPPRVLAPNCLFRARRRGAGTKNLSRGRSALRAVRPRLPVSRGARPVRKRPKTSTAGVTLGGRRDHPPRAAPWPYAPPPLTWPTRPFPRAPGSAPAHFRLRSGRSGFFPTSVRPSRRASTQTSPEPGRRAGSGPAIKSAVCRCLHGRLRYPFLCPSALLPLRSTLEKTRVSTQPLSYARRCSIVPGPLPPLELANVAPLPG